MGGGRPGGLQMRPSSSPCQLSGMAWIYALVVLTSWPEGEVSVGDEGTKRGLRTWIAV